MSLLETGEISKVSSFITVGDEYTDKPEKPLHSVQGVRQFQTTGGVKKGQTGGDWGEGYRSVKPLYQVNQRRRRPAQRDSQCTHNSLRAQGEKYEDVAKLAVREKLKSREKFINPRGFVPSSPSRQR